MRPGRPAAAAGAGARAATGGRAAQQDSSLSRPSSGATAGLATAGMAPANPGAAAAAARAAAGGGAASRTAAGADPADQQLQIRQLPARQQVASGQQRQQQQQEREQPDRRQRPRAAQLDWPSLSLAAGLLNFWREYMDEELATDAALTEALRLFPVRFPQLWQHCADTDGPDIRDLSAAVLGAAKAIMAEVCGGRMGSYGSDSGHVRVEHAHGSGRRGMPDVQQQPEQRQLEQQRRRRQRQQQLQADQQRERLAKDLMSNIRRPRKPKSRASKQLQSAVAAAMGAAAGETGVPVQRRSRRGASQTRSSSTQPRRRAAMPRRGHNECRPPSAPAPVLRVGQRQRSRCAAQAAAAVSGAGGWALASGGASGDALP